MISWLGAVGAMLTLTGLAVGFATRLSDQGETRTIGSFSLARLAAGVALLGAAAFLFAMAYDDSPIVATILAALLGLWSLRRMLSGRASRQSP